MLPTTPAALDRFLTEKEGPSLECKEASAQYSSDKLKKYLSALANAGGGYFVLGVTDQPPREVRGTTVFPSVYADATNFRQALVPAPLLNVREVDHPDGRVLIFEVGPRPPGQPVRYKDVAYTRLGESLTKMSDEELRRVLLENTDLTAQPVGRTLRDLAPDAIEVFRDGVAEKATDQRAARRYRSMEPSALLDAFGLLTTDGHLRQAALLLMGTTAAIRADARNAEIVFEYRKTPGAIQPAPLLQFRGPLLLVLDELWDTIRPLALADGYEVQEGTRVVTEPRFPERSVREVLLNAVAHRDYHRTDEVRVQMDPERFAVTSPGPFQPPVTPKNVADRQARRNPLLAEVLLACGQIERSGLGVDLMIQAAVRRGQALPTFEEPDGLAVRATLYGGHDPDVLARLSAIQDEEWDQISLDELVALDAVRRGVSRSQIASEAVTRLMDRGLVEPGGRGDTPLAYGARINEEGSDLLFLPVVKALADATEGAALSALARTVGTSDVDALKRTLQWMRRNDMAYTTGRTRGARWHLRRERVLRLLEDSLGGSDD